MSQTNKKETNQTMTNFNVMHVSMTKIKPVWWFLKTKIITEKNFHFSSRSSQELQERFCCSTSVYHVKPYGRKHACWWDVTGSALHGKKPTYLLAEILLLLIWGYFSCNLWIRTCNYSVAQNSQETKRIMLVYVTCPMPVQ